MDDYKYLYNNPVMDAFQKYVNEIKYLRETNSDKIDDMIDVAKPAELKIQMKWLILRQMLYQNQKNNGLHKME